MHCSSLGMRGHVVISRPAGQLVVWCAAIKIDSRMHQLLNTLAMAAKFKLAACRWCSGRGEARGRGARGGRCGGVWQRWCLHERPFQLNPGHIRASRDASAAAEAARQIRRGAHTKAPGALMLLSGVCYQAKLSGLAIRRSYEAQLSGIAVRCSCQAKLPRPTALRLPVCSGRPTPGLGRGSQTGAL